MKNRVLLICPEFMGIYHDIIVGLQKLNFSVHYIAQASIPNNPYIVLYKKNTQHDLDKFDKYLINYWKEVLSGIADKDLYFDYVIVIDGLTFHPYLLEHLRNKNPHLVAVNYLYDRVKGVYQIDHNFKYFDHVFSFDISDVKEYHLKLLPIYWVPYENHSTESIDIFAFGSYDNIRMNIYRRIKTLIDTAKLHGFVKLYHPRVNNKLVYSIKRYIKILTNSKSKLLPLKVLDTDLFTNQTLGTEDFRAWIDKANVIVDTNRPYQDGLTARFMWALGAGKKIITNNYHASNYDFYSPEQILILTKEVSDKDLLDFIINKNMIPKDTLEEINKYRIDNWLKTLLDI